MLGRMLLAAVLDSVREQPKGQCLGCGQRFGFAAAVDLDGGLICDDCMPAVSGMGQVYFQFDRKTMAIHTLAVGASSGPGNSAREDDA